MQKTEEIDSYLIKYKKHVFSKNIKISLKEDNNILVTMPYYCPYKIAKEFLLKNFEKIKNLNFKSIKLDENISTKFETLKLIKCDFLKTEVKNNIVYFYYIDINDKNTQKFLKDAYLKALKIEAKNYLPDRVRFLAEKYNFQYGKISLRNQKTRFGSCSFNNDISLNINLMKYDFDCIDYVLIHELCHTKIKNHSIKFWQEVEKYCPDYKNIRKKMRK